MTLDAWWSCWILILISVHANRAANVVCLQSAGNSSFGSTCEGDYCMYAELPGIREPVRGCLSGDLLKSSVIDHCQGTEKKNVCICSTIGCNIDARGIRRHPQTNLLRCYDCESNRCSANSTCLGEYCTLTKYPDGRTVRGCSDPSIPLFERKRLGSCVTPWFPSLVEHDHDRNMGAVRCTCNDRSYCNGRVLTKLVRPEKNTERCPVRAITFTKHGGVHLTQVPDCHGEQCFHVSIEMDDVKRNVSGCMSFPRVRGNETGLPPQHEGLNDLGCVFVQSESFRAEACFHKQRSEMRETSRGRDDEDEEGEDGIIKHSRA